MTAINIGDEIKYFEWNGSSHTEYPAVVRSVLGTGTEDAEDVNLSYQDGAVSRNANNIENVETPASLDGVNYWRRNIVDPNPTDSLPWVSTRPVRGQFVWLIQTEGEGEVIRGAIVRAVLGPPTDPDPRINCFYVNTSGFRVNVSDVDAHDTVTFPTTDPYWADRQLQPGDEALV